MSATNKQASPAAVLPLVFATGVTGLASDLYLPGVPQLPEALGGTIGQAQHTLTVFMLVVAGLQLLYGPLADAVGRFRILLIGSGIFLLGTLGCALSGSLEALIAFRVVQAAGAAAAMAIVPAVIKTSYQGLAGVKMMSWLALSESVVPAAAPLVGAALLLAFDWRACFWVMLAVGLVALGLLVRNREVYVDAAAPSERRPLRLSTLGANYAALLSDRGYLGYALGVSTAFGALMTFVGAAPYLLQAIYGQPPMAFGLMQVAMVAVFMVGSLSAAHAAQRLGERNTVALGLGLLITSGVLMLLVASGLAPNHALTMTLAMLPSQAGLGLRFGVSLNAAMGAHTGREASASALGSFMSFTCAALGNGAVAPFLSQGLWPVAAACAAFAAASLGAFMLLPRPSVEPPDHPGAKRLTGRLAPSQPA